MYHAKQLLHFVGIGGVGMAGIAEVLLNLGYRVSGSDLKSGSLTEHLQELGAKISFGHDASSVPADAAAVVVSSAVAMENPEVIRARELKIPVIPRAEMLGELMRMKYGIAIAGSHGKTTTTTMTARVLSEAGTDPTVIIGGRIKQERSGARLGLGKYLVAEADESDGSFCLLRPAIAVVTNIDVEHLSHYGSFPKLEEAFLSFMSSVPFYGLVVACGDCPVVKRLIGSVPRRVITYGLEPDNDLTAVDIRVERGRSKYLLRTKNGIEIPIELPMPGLHMVSNSLAAAAVGLELGATPGAISRALGAFPGVARRSEIVGDVAGTLVIDDYAHHPTEISATLAAIRSSYLDTEVSPGKMYVLFQPHRYTRTRDLFREFQSCFSRCDELIIGEIYGAGEDEIPGISGKSLSQAIEKEHVSFVSDLNDAVTSLVQRVQPGDVVVTLGAGSVGNLGPVIRRALEGR